MYIKLIELTSWHNEKTKKVWINVDMIGHIIERMVKTESNVTILKLTNIGVLTHNNGGFNVTETVDEVLKKISEVK